MVLNTLIAQLRYSVLVRVAAALLMIAAVCFGDECFRFGQSVTITGELAMHDENSAGQWVAFRPGSAICVVDDPAGETSRVWPAVTELQIVFRDKDSDRLHALVGHAIVIRGKLFGAGTGNNRTEVLIDLADAQRMDAADHNEAVTTKICDLTKSPMRFHGQMVKVHADVAPPTIDSGLALYDLHCSAWINISLGSTPSRADSNANSSANDLFHRYVSENRPFDATLTGRFRMQLMLAGQPVFYMTLRDISDVVLKSAPSSKARRLH